MWGAVHDVMGLAKFTAPLAVSLLVGNVRPEPIIIDVQCDLLKSRFVLVANTHFVANRLKCASQ
jgi:hypothetical protein